MGYSEAGQAPAPAKPTVVPGLPTSVRIEADTSTSIAVEINPPYDNGGDTVDEYLVEWSTESDFSSSTNSSLYMDTTSSGSAGAPFTTNIEDLETGTVYYVRVRAHNSQGYGSPQASSPSFLAAYSVPDPPEMVLIAPTSPRMITVHWDISEDDSNYESIDAFFVEWDVSADFDSTESYPHKANFRVEKDDRSYTIDYLDPERMYYVRVAALNPVGVGDFTDGTYGGTSNGVQPAHNRPGKPVNLEAVTGVDAGELDVSWSYPSVPHHGFTCYGSQDNPGTCPTNVGDELPASSGGREIYEYRLQWSVSSDFLATETDAGEADVSDTFSYTLTNLTVGYNYYVRVAARTQVGFGAFCQEGGEICGDGVRVNATAHP
mmetsp:Transcript_13942/g.22010  ORF Transcript_13942/g.22010 Transcript_13942/m.22010 type:complete len:376 (+) Transcript_13942:3-1130(+)